MTGGAICLVSWTVIQENGWHTHSVPSGYRLAYRTLEIEVLERFPDGVIPPHFDLATRSDGGCRTRLLGL